MKNKDIGKKILVGTAVAVTSSIVVGTIGGILGGPPGAILGAKIGTILGSGGSIMNA